MQTSAAQGKPVQRRVKQRRTRARRHARAGLFKCALFPSFSEVVRFFLNNAAAAAAAAAETPHETTFSRLFFELLSLSLFFSLASPRLFIIAAFSPGRGPFLLGPFSLLGFGFHCCRARELFLLRERAFFDERTHAEKNVQFSYWQGLLDCFPLAPAGSRPC